MIYYVAMYLGIICGYILRVVAKITKKKGKANKGLIPALSYLYTYIKWNSKKFIYLFKKTFLYIKISMQKRVFDLKRFIIFEFHKNMDLLKQKLLSNTVIYIWLKVAKVYSHEGRKVVLLHYSSVKNYCNEHNTKYFVIENEQNRPVCKPEYFEMKEEIIEYYRSPEIYVAQILEATISGGSSIIIADGKCIYDPFITDTEKRLDIKFSNTIGKVNSELIVEVASVRKKIVEAIMLTGFASYNYYHLTVEIMSRLKYVDSIEEYRRVPLIVDEIIFCIPQYKELLDKINVYCHPVITVKQGENVIVKNLIIPAYNTWMPINVRQREMIRTSDFLIARSALENIRSSLPEPKGRADKYIFISRKNLGTARLRNESEIAKLFENNGFEIAFTENLSYIEQVELFQKAKCVVATSGAALTNILYCSKGTDIICIIPEEYKFYMYSTIAYLLELHPLFLNANVKVKTAYTASDVFELDLEYCKRFLKWYMTREER